MNVTSSRSSHPPPLSARSLDDSFNLRVADEISLFLVGLREALRDRDILGKAELQNTAAVM